MELKELFHIIKRKTILIVLIMVIILAGTFIATKKAKNQYETSAIITIQANKEKTDQYQYGGFYSIQASELFINTILGWIGSPNIAAEIYTKSGITVDDAKIKSLEKEIYSKKVPPQNIMLSITDSDEANSKKLMEGTIGVIKDKTSQLALIANTSTSFEIISSELITTTIKQNLPFNMAVAFILSLILSLILVLGIEYMSPTINSIQKIKNIFNLSPISLRGLKLKGLVNLETREAEKFRFLRANIAELGETKKTSIMIAGLNEQTITPLLSANLALSFARSGKKTILIDANFLNPIIHEFFGKENAFGFSEFLFDEQNIDKYLQKTDEKNLRIISSGIKLSYASDTIERANAENVFKEIQKHADVIIVNVPALNLSSEAFPLFSIIQKTMLVVKLGKTNISAATYVNSFLEKKEVEKYVVVI